MKKAFFYLIGFLSIHTCSFGQSTDEKIAYIVDSILVANDPEEGDEILQDDIADLTVIKNKDSLKNLGYERFDGVIYLFTKEYRKRPEKIKEIPTTKRMKKKNGAWSFGDTPYSGPFIDYYYSGRKEGEGTLQRGKVDGLRTLYYPNGKIAAERNYKEGIAEGWEKEYYPDGSLKQVGEVIHGSENGVWKTYYPNGQIKLYENYRNGEAFDSAINYYSTGKIKERVFFKNGKQIPDPGLMKISQYMAKSAESNKEGDLKNALKNCTQAIELDSGYAMAYFSRGTLKLNNMQFDEAIADFDKALELEPFMEFALANRAFARIRKYEMGNNRTLLKNSEVTVMASKKSKASIPREEQEKICNDLQNAKFLGYKSAMATEALSNYCH